MQSDRRSGERALGVSGDLDALPAEIAARFEGRGDQGQVEITLEIPQVDEAGGAGMRVARIDDEVDPLRLARSTQGAVRRQGTETRQL